MKKKILLTPLLILFAGLFTSCSVEDPTKDEFVINYVKLHAAYYEMLGGEMILAAMDVDMDYSTYIENAIDAFEDAKGSIRDAFYQGNDITSDSYDKEDVDDLIKDVEKTRINLVITTDNRPKSCVIKDMASDLSFQITYSGNTMTIEEL